MFHLPKNTYTLKTGSKFFLGLSSPFLFSFGSIMWRRFGRNSSVFRANVPKSNYKFQWIQKGVPFCYLYPNAVNWYVSNYYFARVIFSKYCSNFNFNRKKRRSLCKSGMYAAFENNSKIVHDVGYGPHFVSIPCHYSANRLSWKYEDFRSFVLR